MDAPGLWECPAHHHGAGGESVKENFLDKQYGFFFDSSACSGCKSCQVACKDKHDLDVGLLWRRVYEVSGGDWQKKGKTWISGVFAYNISLACNHCEEPVCMFICPNKAIIKRRDGIVLIDEKMCMGCRYCEWACPYGSPQYDKRSRVMTKCHFCFDAIDRGESPACVSACPMRALDYGEVSALRKVHGDTKEIYPLPKSTITKPALVIKPHKDVLLKEKEKAEIMNREEVGHAKR
jgi:anaerobic dimethyl sulfoxide reductase subunit B (iron-sulfur subunit)